MKNYAAPRIVNSISRNAPFCRVPVADDAGPMSFEKATWRKKAAGISTDGH